MVSGTDDTPGGEVATPTVCRSFLEVAGNKRSVAVFAQGQLGQATAVIVDLLRALQDVATSVSNDAATTVQSAVESFPPRAADPSVQQRFVNAVFERLEGGRRRWRTTSHQLLDARRAIEEQYRRLLDLERLAATGTVAASVAHDLNNPLGTIAMAATTLPSVDDPEEHARLAGIVEREALRAGRITTDLLTFVSRRDPVRHAVANVLDNALAAPGRVGPVTISATCERRDLMLRIEDDGEGIPAALAARVFTPFVTTKPEGQGTGLGLVIARRHAEDHGGTVTIDRTGRHGPGRATARGRRRRRIRRRPGDRPRQYRGGRRFRGRSATDTTRGRPDIVHRSCARTRVGRRRRTRDPRAARGAAAP